MIKRTLYIGNPAYLKLKQNQMLIEDAETKIIKGSIPIEDMALLVLDHFQITISNQLLIRLQGSHVAVVNCDAHHLPLGLMLPLYGHSEYSVCPYNGNINPKGKWCASQLTTATLLPCKRMSN